MEDGDWIRIDFTGRVKATGEVFDLTSEHEARALGIYDQKQRYGPRLVILGKHMILPALEDEIKKMSVGEERRIELENAFGIRNPAFIKIIPIAHFLKQKINPAPGMLVDIDGILAKIQSVSGGRVRVDFNHPLAGKTVVYDVKVVEKIERAEDKVRAYLEYIGVKADVKFEAGNVEIVTENVLDKAVEEKIKKDLSQIKGIENIKFTTLKA